MSPRLPWACGLLLLVAGCDDAGGDGAFTRTRVARTAPTVEAGVSAASRFRLQRRQAPPAAAGEQQLPFRWKVPAGWTQLPGTAMRLINLQANDPSVECYVTFLPGAAGGLEANVNRWRKQMGLEPASAEAIAALPRQELLGRTGVRVELSGAFAGMGGEARPDSKLVGVILASAQGTLFVKMTGPAAQVDAAQPGFAEFCAGLQPSTGAADHDHADHEGHDHADHAAGGGQAPAPDADADAAPAHGPRSPDLLWAVPAGWRPKGSPAGTIRLFTFEAGQAGAECMGGILGGSAADVSGVVAMWYRQLGLDAPDAAGLAALPRIPMAGSTDGVLVDLQGTLTDMKGNVHEGRGLVAAVVVLDAGTVYAKLTGPTAAVAEQRDTFVAFCGSLRLP